MSRDAIEVCRAGDGWRAIDLIADLHLGPETPRTTAALCHHLRHTDAQAVFLLGDVFEVWIGDDALDEPGATEAGLLAALAEAGRGRHLALMPGNRDFLLGARAARAAGWAVLPDPCVLEAFGHRLVLVHGDALCLADTEYQRFRATSRTPGWQAAFLAQPVAQRRAVARALRDDSERRKRREGHAAYPDLDRDAMLALLERAGARQLVHGHTHRPGDETLAPGRTRHVLTDWDLDDPDPGAHRTGVLRLDAAGLHRRPPC